MSTLRLKRNESFSIRDGWIDKAINAISTKKDVFCKNNGIEYLGIGANMVKGLKYWLIASNIYDSKLTELTEFGKLLMKFDPYLESVFSWFMIHYFLCTNFDDSPIFFTFFNKYKINGTEKKEIITWFCDYYREDNYEFNRKALEDDVSIMLKSYIKDDESSNPEENYSCPLANLNLVELKGNQYYKTKAHYNDLNCYVILFVLSTLYADSFDIAESSQCEKSPCLIFNIDKNMYFQYLEELKNKGLITINKTAGLNTVCFNDNYSLRQIFELNFEGKKHEI